MPETTKYKKQGLLKERLKQEKINYRIASKASGISLSAFNNKMNGVSEFTLTEIIGIINLLHLTAEEVTAIFFD